MLFVSALYMHFINIIVYLFKSLMNHYHFGYIGVLEMNFYKTIYLIKENTKNLTTLRKILFILLFFSLYLITSVDKSGGYFILKFRTHTKKNYFILFIKYLS